MLKISTAVDKNVSFALRVMKYETSLMFSNERNEIFRIRYLSLQFLSLAVLKNSRKYIEELSTMNHETYRPKFEIIFKLENILLVNETGKKMRTNDVVCRRFS